MGSVSTPDFDSIPVLDLHLAEHDRSQFLSELRHAIVDIGFLYLKNTDVKPAVIGSVVNALPQLFALPLDAKHDISIENSPHFLGYSALGTETTAGKQDLREQVEFATAHGSTWHAEQPLYQRLKGPSQYPSGLSIVKTAVNEYIEALTCLAVRFQQLVAEALDLPDDTFLAFLSGFNRLKLVRYPAVESHELETQGVGPHKDSSGWWTFLLQASPPEVKGLQVLNKRGQWIDVPNIPGTFIVNIGQAFEVVTHGMCKATTHRVLAGTRERYSIPFFQGVRGDLTKQEALGTLAEHFKDSGIESSGGAGIDSAFLKGKYDTWGESQLRTKIRSHRDVGRRHYLEVYDMYINDD